MWSRACARGFLPSLSRPLFHTACLRLETADSSACALGLQRGAAAQLPRQPSAQVPLARSLYIVFRNPTRAPRRRRTFRSQTANHVANAPTHRRTRRRTARTHIAPASSGGGWRAYGMRHAANSNVHAARNRHHLHLHRRRRRLHPEPCVSWSERQGGACPLRPH